MWEAAYGIGAVVLAAAIGWGIYQSNRRPRSNERITEAATEELYKSPDRYERKTHDELADKAE